MLNETAIVLNCTPSAEILPPAAFEMRNRPHCSLDFAQGSYFVSSSSISPTDATSFFRTSFDVPLACVVTPNRCEISNIHITYQASFTFAACRCQVQGRIRYMHILEL